MTFGNQVSNGLHPPVRDQDLSLFPSLPPCQPVAGCTCPNHRPSRSLAGRRRPRPSSAHSTTATEQPNNLLRPSRPSVLYLNWVRLGGDGGGQSQRNGERAASDGGGGRKEERLDAAANRDFDARMQNPRPPISSLHSLFPRPGQENIERACGNFSEVSATITLPFVR